MNTTDKTLQAFIRQSQKDTSRKYHSICIGNNLWFRVHSKTGNAAWLFRISLPDQTKKSGYKFSFKTIGKYPLITLQQAKIEGMNLSHKVSNGIDPVKEDLQVQKSTITFKQIWDKWISIAPIKEYTKQKLIGIYSNHLSKISDYQIEKVTDATAWNSIIQPIIDNKNFSQAKMVLQKLKQVCRFAYTTHMIDTLKFDRMELPNEYKVKKIRERTLSVEELTRFLTTINTIYEEQLIDIRNHHFLIMVLILGTRKTELAKARWSNYDKNKQTLLITETKTDDDLLIKLPHQVITMIDELKQLQINDYIFFGMKTNQHMSIRSILYMLHRVTKHAQIEDLTVHDLRRTFSSRLSGLGYRYELIDKATNHKVQGTARHYQHDDMLEERYKMLQNWADYLDNLQNKGV